MSFPVFRLPSSRAHSQIDGEPVADESEKNANEKLQPQEAATHFEDAMPAAAELETAAPTMPSEFAQGGFSNPPEVLDEGLTQAEQAIVNRMQKLSPQDGRYLVLEAALAFKASWVMLGEHLTDVADSRQWRKWGYKSFATYCADEIRVTSTTARKLVKSFRWLGEEAPEYIPRVENGRSTPTREVPDFNAIGVLADARKELEKERVPEDAYLALKAAAFDGETTAVQLRKELKESIPEELKEKPITDKVRLLRKALTTSVKLIEQLSEWDGDDELVLEVEALRDKITAHLPKENEVQPEEEVELVGDADGVA